MLNISLQSDLLTLQHAAQQPDGAGQQHFLHLQHANQQSSGPSRKGITFQGPLAQVLVPKPLVGVAVPPQSWYPHMWQTTRKNTRPILSTLQVQY